jgi:hypothetical protein
MSLHGLLRDSIIFIYIYMYMIFVPHKKHSLVPRHFIGIYLASLPVSPISSASFIIRRLYYNAHVNGIIQEKQLSVKKFSNSPGTQLLIMVPKGPALQQSTQHSHTLFSYDPSVLWNTCRRPKETQGDPSI